MEKLKTRNFTEPNNTGSRIKTETGTGTRTENNLRLRTLTKTGSNFD